MSNHSLDSFNAWIGWALGDLAALPDLPAAVYPWSRRHRVEMAMTSLRSALKRANEMGCPARKALCMRVLNWLRADMRRAA
ncbi:MULTISPECIES: hypothetical protein [unclassified Bosea (in: a-proteobacteria)]|uniref:hypothetical protein n=1 Tax=unclassified Bosea (in: a-proteobacteria) TaxID=2653178 RepID=UPI000F75E11D|nr:MULTISPECIES: hypothetical protein [unclassified Bosea (in: a-proteobacteria)]AZO77517.1 hypothetical protein BLM15_07730 [Bosea sp. Tri-49]RXT18125.1 hypothetical protein B5U98_22895 [Bosea sp. Tri-39]RXT32722.1 hypothetical protein B5U99_29240 [Bosea sp. Tri-54]